MSESTDPVHPSSAATPETREAPVLFGAFQERKSRGGRWALLAISLAGVAIWAAAQDAAHTRQVVTPRGVRAVHVGMTSEEVRTVLGSPFAIEQRRGGRGECYLHGHPTLEQAVFPVYSLCYEDGKLRDVTVRHFSSMAVGSDGAPLSPPGATSRPPRP